MSADFQGFPPQALRFFKQLEKNNDKAWFDAHRSDYDNHVMAPARAFVEAMGARLSLIAPAIQAQPRVNGSIFRIFRDTRFSKDKTPYKTNLAIWFWEGGQRMDSSGFYFALEPESVGLGSGMYRFPKAKLASYRKAVDHPKSGEALARIVSDLEKQEDLEVAGQHYKRVPRGFDPDSKRADLLRHNGLYTHKTCQPPPQLHRPDFLDYCFQRYHAVLPLHQWLRDEL